MRMVIEPRLWFSLGNVAENEQPGCSSQRKACFLHKHKCATYLGSLFTQPIATLVADGRDSDFHTQKYALVESNCR